MSPPARSLALALALAVSATSHASNTTLLRATAFVATPAFESPLMRRWGFAIFVRVDAFVLMAGVDPGPDPTPEFETHLPLVVFRDVWTAPVSVQGLAWTRLADEAPWPARARPSVAVVDAGVLLMSGVDRNGNVMNDVWWSSDPEFAFWQKRPDFPWASRDGFSVGTMQGTQSVFIFGGRTAGKLTNELWTTEDLGLSWSQMYNGDQSALGEPRIWVSGAAGPGGFMFFGGLCDDALYPCGTTLATGNLGHTWQLDTANIPDGFALTAILNDDGSTFFGGANPHRVCWMLMTTGSASIFERNMENHLPWCSFDRAPANDPEYFAKWHQHIVSVSGTVFVFGAASGARANNAAVYASSINIHNSVQHWDTLCVPSCSVDVTNNGCGGTCPSALESPRLTVQFILAYIVLPIIVLIQTSALVHVCRRRNRNSVLHEHALMSESM